jgi:hypothetical protein
MRGEEITWLVTSLRDMITKQNHTIEEISAGQKALEAQNEKIQRHEMSHRVRRRAPKVVIALCRE